ncbi:MAG: hypothetical protein M0Z38_01600, partial [Deltaproteobacteria bacterium]|nr:hypothetical protein [Deltaproteobacteria bacterium]
MGLALLLAAAGPVFAQAPPALPPGVTPQQAEAAKQAIKSGAPLPPEAQKALDARPDLKEQLPADIKEKLEAKEKEAEAAKKPPVPPAQETPPEILPTYDWRTSTYVGSLFSKRLHDAETRTLAHFGHDVFAPRLGAAATLENMPVTPDYVVGPGDEVIV